MRRTRDDNNGSYWTDKLKKEKVLRPAYIGVYLLLNSENIVYLFCGGPRAHTPPPRLKRTPSFPIFSRRYTDNWRLGEERSPQVLIVSFRERTYCPCPLTLYNVRWRLATRCARNRRNRRTLYTGRLTVSWRSGEFQVNSILVISPPSQSLCNDCLSSINLTLFFFFYLTAIIIITRAYKAPT